VVFKNQARGETKTPKRFINDTIRNDFHRKFLHKYMKYFLFKYLKQKPELYWNQKKLVIILYNDSMYSNVANCYEI
jgi:hypothetical protein